ncbi:glycosyltransferase family 92 protein RCOM_0530710-like [Arachis ipaensis]|uniref:glycosyltransferase family 92 protein RCOM_0530710-like n=1 Tax=Arachis ipaensis TaxID=130454 RepID=UPI000A2B1B66|nr:glycosyltransferase family 92 protein RCOM_0530710-like [Arachis ipaensis]
MAFMAGRELAVVTMAFPHLVLSQSCIPPLVRLSFFLSSLKQKRRPREKQRRKEAKIKLTLSLHVLFIVSKAAAPTHSRGVRKPSFFLFFNFNTATLLRPPLALSLLYSSAISNSILDPLTPLTSSTPSFTLQHRIQFPNHYLLLLLLTNHHINPHQLECVYYYEASLDRESNIIIVFVKGLNLRPHKVSNLTHFRCHFGFKNLNKDGSFFITTRTVLVAQEVVRCLLPQGVRNNTDRAKGVGVTVSHLSGNFRYPVCTILLSIARIDGNDKKKREKYELCVCTMVWNQGSVLREWVMYHAWLGVERWFIYDNNSDDDIEEVIQDLDSQGFNVTR